MSAGDLEKIIEAADPAVRFVPPRLVRRLLSHLELELWLGPRAVYRLAFVVDPAAAAGAFDDDELSTHLAGINIDRAAGSLILFAKPDSSRLSRYRSQDVLLSYWRKLFHARYRISARCLLEQGSPDPDIQARIAEIGQVEFAEATDVLCREGLLLSPFDDITTLVTFEATFHELSLFAPDWLEAWFPAIADHARLGLSLRERGPDPLAIAAATRPSGAPDPASWRETRARRLDASPAADPIEREPSSWRLKWLAKRAGAATRTGNDVRAAILGTQRSRLIDPKLAEVSQAAVRVDLNRLARRLRLALSADGAEASAWRRGFTALIDRAATGFWTPEARWLYTIQKVCVDHERDFLAIEPLSWLFSLGKRPIRRLLPHHQAVASTRHLRSARTRLSATTLSAGDRENLEHLLDRAVKRAEESLRTRFRPLITEALTKTAPRPRNLVERAGFAKLAEELADPIADRGFLQMGDVRDSLARNCLKLGDLAIPNELVFGDALLKLDRELARRLDEVYRPGEIYLRFLQKVCSIAFGTKLGRIVTLYVALPFGGSFIAIAGTQHLINLILFLLKQPGIELVSPTSIASIGLFVLALMRSTRFRTAASSIAHRLGRAGHWFFFKAFPDLWNSEFLKRIRRTPAFVWTWRLLLKPAALTLPFWPFLLRGGIHGSALAVAMGSVAGIWSVIFNTRVGRDAEELAVDALIRFWQRVRIDFLPGLFQLVIDLFRAIVEFVDRILHAVDEWLRFRSGQTNAMLIGKAVLVMLWSVLAYLIRIYVNVLIEPQINPVKHFPVVTVSHKIMLPSLPYLTRVFAAPLAPLVGSQVAAAVAGATVLLLPGAFGFLVWELKENWRLYEANRPKSVAKTNIGRHGETMVRLLQPGLHSGTVPKAFAKLRTALRAQSTGDKGGSGTLAHRVQAIHEIEHAIHRFIERDILCLFRIGEFKRLAQAQVVAVHLSTNRVTIAIAQAHCEPLRIHFEEISGRLRSRTLLSTWTESLDLERSALLDHALAGLNAMAGVNLVDASPRHPLLWRTWVEGWEQPPQQQVSDQEPRLSIINTDSRPRLVEANRVKSN